MTKGILNLYIDRDLVEIAKKRNFNLSRYFESVLNIELGIDEIYQISDKDDLILKLKSKNALLMNEVKLLNDKYESILREKSSLLEEIDKLKQKIKENRKKVFSANQDVSFF